MVTAGIGEDEIADRFKGANDDYSSIMVKALADRLAEAFAERLHQRVRKEFWGYAPDETLSRPGLIGGEIPRHPAGAGLSGAARPHREGDAVPAARRRAAIGVKLTESFAMWPGASVCGLYFSHPQSHYFGVGKIERDQVEDYARRKGWTRARRRSAGSRRSSTTIRCPCSRRRNSLRQSAIAEPSGTMVANRSAMAASALR